MLVAKKKRKPVKIPTPKEIRAIRGDLTQEEAAAKVGVARRTWMYYEADKQTPSEAVAILIWLLKAGRLD